MNKYKLKIKKIIRQLKAGIYENVALVAWVDVIGTDSRGAQHTETLEVSFNQPSSGQFIAYQDLTEPQVNQWITDALNNTPQSQFDDQADPELTRMQYIRQIIDERLQEIELASDYLPWEHQPELYEKNQ